MIFYSVVKTIFLSLSITMLAACGDSLESPTENETGSQHTQFPSPTPLADNLSAAEQLGKILYNRDDLGCRSCHGDRGESALAIDSNKNVYSHANEPDISLALDEYISQWMPVANTQKCSGTCAENIASYIKSWNQQETEPATPDENDTATDNTTPNDENDTNKEGPDSDQYQLSRAQSLYETLKCVSCHGDQGKNTNYPIDALKTEFSHSTAPETKLSLKAYIVKWMPTQIGLPADCGDACADDLTKLIRSWLLESTPETTPPPTPKPTASSTPKPGVSKTPEPTPPSPAPVVSASQLYQTLCAGCHGTTGTGNPGVSLLDSIKSGKAINYTTKSMPIKNPSACDLDCAKNVIAWVAQQNDIDLKIEETEQENEDKIMLEPRAQTYRRAAMLFSQSLPSSSSIKDLDLTSDEKLKVAISNSMNSVGFKRFIKDGANDKLLLRGIISDSYRAIERGLESHYPEYQKGKDENNYYHKSLAVEFAESPLELIYSVVADERPYSEILTTDHVMVSQHMATIYQTGLTLNVDQWQASTDNGQRLSDTRSSPMKNWDESRSTTRPHAGILTSWAFTSRYPTTATNRNRARSKHTMLNFLGYDIEASAPRLELDDSINTDNPTLNNPACTSCHIVMDPIAGAFQSFGNRGVFNEGRYGIDSLDNDYKKSQEDYVSGETWYNDMLAPGFADTDAPAGSNDAGQANSIVWLAQQIVNDERFATGAVKFWWPAVFGRDIGDEDDELIQALADNFRTSQNLKTLLVDMVMSTTYRQGELNETAYPRLVTPELMTEKYNSLSDVASSFSDPHLLFFGGHDSWVRTKRERDINALMLNVLKYNAYKYSCKIAFDDFQLPLADRLLFSDIELNTLAGSLTRFTTLAVSSKEHVNTQVSLDVKDQTSISMALRTIDENDLILTNLKVETGTGTIIFDGSPLSISDENGVLVNNAREYGESLGFYQNYHNVLLTLPGLPENLSEIKITLTTRARADDSEAASLIVDVIGDNDINSTASDKIKTQLASLTLQLWGEAYEADSIEIKALYQLFVSLQSNAQNRGLTDTQYSTNYQCSNVTLVRYYDIDYTFAAWKGVLAAMLSDASFLLN